MIVYKMLTMIKFVSRFCLHALHFVSSSRMLAFSTDCLYSLINYLNYELNIGMWYIDVQHLHAVGTYNCNMA